MNEFASNIGPYIERLFDYRQSLGYSQTSHKATLLNFDRFCASYYPDANFLSEEMVLSWIKGDKKTVYERCVAIRLLGKYMSAIGKPAYILPEKFVSLKQDFSPYIFTDCELTRLFASIDRIDSTKEEPYINVMSPILFRLIYTCGLRPNEGREIKCDNVHLDTGEIMITNTKKKKDRVVVMSGDMLSLMKSYYVERSFWKHENEYLFPSATGGPISSAVQSRVFKNAWIAANPDVPKSELPPVRVYDLRHRFASATLVRWLERGDSLKNKLPYLCKYMGHKSLHETHAYIHILPENLTQSSAIDWSGFYDLLPEVPHE